MNFRQEFLFGYRLLLRLYPPAFRERFAPEMLELAQAADRAEWPLIFGDTSVAIVRCWIEGTQSTALATEPNAYLSLGESSIRPSQVLQGMLVFLVIIGGMVYINHRWPATCSLSLYPEHPVSTSNVQR